MRRIPICCISFILFISCTLSLSRASYIWSDCGVQLSKYIQYEEITIYPTSVSTNNTLSINIQASIVSTISDADTYLTVWKDGELFLSVKIQDLCTIIHTTSSLSCPLSPGPLSFTYSWLSIPYLVTGNYAILIQSIISGQEIGCLSISGRIGGLQTPGSCTYQSGFTSLLVGNPIYDDNNPPQYIQVGSMAPDCSSLDCWGAFSSFMGTPDLGTVDVTHYRWGLNGSLITPVGDNVYIYGGALYVMSLTGSALSLVYSGQFEWNVTFTTGKISGISGLFWFSPVYEFTPPLYPSVLGNLANFSVQQQPDESFLVTGQRLWCTCGVDSCNVCGGDGICQGGNTEGGTTNNEDLIVAIVVGVGGGIIAILAVIGFTYLILTSKKRRRLHESAVELIDQPEKPDYGALAIDEVIQESEQM